MLEYKECSFYKEEDAISEAVLIVEDDIDIGEFLVQAIMEETSHKAMLVTDGFMALNAIAKIKPTLFILDYQMPRMNGIQLYDRLHEMQEFQDVPIIMISAYLPQQEVAKRKIIGIRKPLDLNMFLDMVEKLLA